MIAEIVAWGVLMGLVVFQQVYWMTVSNKLMDRVMARDFSELAQVENYRRTKPQARAPQVEAVDDYAEAQAERANHLLGV